MLLALIACLSAAILFTAQSVDAAPFLPGRPMEYLYTSSRTKTTSFYQFQASFPRKEIERYPDLLEQLETLFKQPLSQVYGQSSDVYGATGLGGPQQLYVWNGRDKAFEIFMVKYETFEPYHMPINFWQGLKLPDGSLPPQTMVVNGKVVPAGLPEDVLIPDNGRNIQTIEQNWGKLPNSFRYIERRGYAEVFAQYFRKQTPSDLADLSTESLKGKPVVNDSPGSELHRSTENETRSGEHPAVE